MSVWFSGQNLGPCQIVHSFSDNQPTGTGWGRAIILYLDFEWKINRLEVVLKFWDGVGLEVMNSMFIFHFSTNWGARPNRR